MNRRQHNRNLAFFLMHLLLYYTADAQTLKQVPLFGHNPGNLSMYYYAPEVSHSQAVPMVVALHGCYETAKSYAELSGWNKLADSCGFIVLYPQQRFANNEYRCFNWFLENDVLPDEGESASIRSMITYMQHMYPIDTTKIFVVGVSAGGAMAVVLLA